MKRPGSLLALLLLLVGLAVPVQAQQFGGTLAVGDEDVFVGETRNMAFPGLVYVFHREGEDGMWKEAAQLTPSDASDKADGFGRALAAEGRTLLVGANSQNASAGAVYVFWKNDDGAWAEAARLSASDGVEGTGFGTAVALSGDVALVSSSGRDEKIGAVYVLRRDADGAWAEHTKLTASDGQAGDGFGATLALDGDAILVGAPAQNESTGAVYVFRHDAASDSWSETGKLEADGLEEGNRFGASLGIKKGFLYAGAPRFGGREGVVFVFEQDPDTGTWTQQTRLAPFVAGRNTQFGSSIAFDGDDVWIGTPGDARSTGALYVFQRDDASGSWTGATKRGGHNLQPRASFANTMTIQGDLAVVGATGVDFGQGAAIVFERDADGAWRQKNTVINEMKGYASIVGGEVKCNDDKAALWECSDVDLVSFLSIKDMGGGRGVGMNDIWGWTDPETGKEYALVGRTDGAVFIDVSDPFNPVYVGELPKTEGSRTSAWRDIKVYKDHAFIVADGAGEHGMQVFDLAQLRNVTNPPVTFEATVLYDKIASAHNIVINEETGFAFSVGSSGGGETCGGGLHMINIQEPTNPTFASCFADPTTGRRKTGYVHDAQCVIYHGPDTEHQGKEICLGSNETALSIADVTDKENPVALAMASYPNVAYTHQGWLTEDHTYFYMNDEGDEPQGLVDGTRTLVWDVSDLDDPILVKEYIAETKTTDHNLYIRGNLMYQSNYGSGLRILDITNPENPVEVGFFDTVPYDGGGGSWSNYPYFKSGVIVVTSMREGLFLLKKKDIDI